MGLGAFALEAKQLEECITDRDKDVVEAAGGVEGRVWWMVLATS
jgi:hypothetical protein